MDFNLVGIKRIQVVYKRENFNVLEVDFINKIVTQEKINFINVIDLKVVNFVNFYTLVDEKV